MPSFAGTASTTKHDFGNDNKNWQQRACAACMQREDKKEADAPADRGDGKVVVVIHSQMVDVRQIELASG